MLLRALPYGSPLHESVWREQEAAQKPSVEKLRERQAYYEQRAKEAANG